MNANNSIASFWNSYTSADKVPKLLTGKAVPLASDPAADAFHADETTGDTMLEVVEYHQ